MKTVLALVLTSMMIVALPAAAKKEGHGNPHAQDDAYSQSGKPAKAGKSKDGGGDAVSISISAGISVGGARDIARDVGIRPGTYQSLPPGMHNRLAKGKPLPPGIAKKQVNPQMLARLPAHPGHEWLVIGIDLVLVNIQTKIPVDILPGVF
ncbi:anti-virulence regulator CigR family protein [Uliginosibacterium sp. 31-12]|uniref:anti-virulence regulator CigR family protein n=1 Tax=Uliginosibacterium sp. 31-12 TaxID=3062781 RepID=UPI0026E232DC|nr:anti-virulence regulator CigR family protein [Uliginosibacterium sp. 31-12]MDO6388032.1 anti-virulence regulator CigR family protein [Uliginosibacterium sp. 31-12]